MKLKSGEEASGDAELECTRCQGRTFVSQGRTVPRCAQCLGREFQKRRDLTKRMVFMSVDMRATP
jgi:hypothetical protein